MTIKQLARDNIDDIRDGISWLIVYKNGRSWCYNVLWPDYRSDNGDMQFDAGDVETAQNALAVDPNAVILNAYYCNLGDPDYMTIDRLASAIYWQYQYCDNRLCKVTL